MNGREQPDETAQTQEGGPASTPELDMLNEIMDRSMAKATPGTDGSAQDPAPGKPSSGFAPEGAKGPDEENPARPSGPEGTSPKNVSHETTEEGRSSESTPSKNKPSSFYIYLAVLFGAAFLMLLLAYFVQQRNNATVLDDLRLASASREELMASIKDLEETNHDLAKDNGLLKYERGHYQELYQKAQNSSDQLSGELQHAQEQFNAAVILSWLERFCGERDYLMAAVVVEQCDQYFNEHNKFCGNRVPIPAAMVSRYLQLREDVVMEKAQCMMTERYYGQDQESYTEEIRIVPSANGYSEEAVRAARTLWSIFWLYSDSVDMPAWQMAQFCAPGSDGLYQLNSRAFQPSTRELFEEVKADLTAQGALTEVDGVLKPVQDGQVVEHIPTEDSISEPTANP